ncbi:tyrosine-type recombinase/integrase [Paucibacter sp. R3-3]|uniref:Tyrosine-type recombinase/integrase n=1 Tax=Roseateles agri TaxID=3098619 RepID=A0ABU5DNP1_9BURK|nr:tyrosine-type recombinase/integrase [Paucibacter sp. R3-3]MDY0746909.1 tyrosine-type recombinase/integrase [Paucibacter sp. R3-3]
MATRRPKGSRWTVTELRNVPTDWAGDTLGDGDGLTGEVRVSSRAEVTIRWRYAFKWEGKVKRLDCGFWPAVDLAGIRRTRDEARLKLREGINPSEHRQAERIQAQQEVKVTLAAEALRQADAKINNDLIDAWLQDGVKRSDGNLGLRQLLDKNVRPVIGTKLVAETTEHDLRVLLKVIVGRGANRMAVAVRNDLAQMYHWAEKRQPWRRLLAEGNPIDLVDIKTVVSPGYDIDYARERVLSVDELTELRDIFAAMGKDAATLTRKDLYELVWHTPIMRLAHQLGISDRGLSKICERRSIPTPSRGHWHRVALQTAAAPTPLPEPDWNPWVDLVRSQRGLSTKYQCAVWLCLLTTCRIGELLLTEKKHINFEKGEWFIPKENSKSTRGRRRDFMVFLSPQAAEQFKVLFEMAGDSRWVFPSPDKEDGPIGEKALTMQVGDRQLMFKQLSRKPKKRVLDNSLVLSGGENGEWTPHDLRRTSATTMQRLGIPADLIDRCQNHLLGGPKVRRHYLLYDFADEKRAAWVKLGEHVDAILRAKLGVAHSSGVTASSALLEASKRLEAITEA